MTDYSALLSVAKGAVDLGESMMLNGEAGEITAKGDRDMASALDFEIERKIRSYLSIHTPDVGFLGEEEGTGPAGLPEQYWVLDPIDGTANFVHGVPLCAISLALVQNNQAVVGVTSLPFMGNRYQATSGGGALKDGNQISTRITTELSAAMVSIGDYAVGTDANDKNVQRLLITARLAAQVERVRMLGSAVIDLMWVAEGILDGTIMLGNKPWDTAAGVLIAREAGASVLDLDGSDHSTESTATIVGATPQLAARLVRLTE